MAADGEQATNPAPPTPPFQLPSYPEMILEAIDALDNEKGSNKTAISGYIKRKYGSGLPPSHVSILAANLQRMKTTGELVFSRNNYFRPDKEEEEPRVPAPADPSSRRGQDPEPEDTVSEVPDGAPAPDPNVAADVVLTTAHAVADAVSASPPVVAADAPVAADDADGVAAAAPAVAADAGALPVKRGRGRPPKPKDLVAKEPDVAPVAAPISGDDADGASAAPAPVVAADAVAVPVKRGRGRPPKPKEPVTEATVVGSPAAAPVDVDDANAVPAKRGRGRPSKPKDPVVEAVAVATSGMPRARGRPPKKARVAQDEAPIGSPAPAAGGATVPVKRGRGRPPKVKPPVDA